MGDFKQLLVQLHIACTLLQKLLVELLFFIRNDQGFVDFFFLAQALLQLLELLFHISHIGGLVIVDMPQLQQTGAHQIRVENVDHLHAGQGIARNGLCAFTHGAQLHQGHRHHDQQQGHQDCEGSQNTGRDLEIFHE